MSGRLNIRISRGEPGLSVVIAALLVLGCGEAEPTSPAPPAPPPVASVLLDRDTATVAAGGTVQLAVTLKDAQGAALTGRPVTWSSSSVATATVSNTGLVTGAQVGQSRIVATAEGKSDTAIVLVPPAQLTVTPESASAKTVTLGSAGGVIHTVGSDGIRYTLVVPPLALQAPVAITMTPLADVTGLPLSGGFVAGVDFKPDGLVFAQPATLTIEIITHVPGGQRLVGFTATSTGDSLGVIPARRAPNTITLSVGHFSISGAGFGTVQDLDALFLATPFQPGISDLFVHSLTLLSQSSPRDGAFELKILEKWFDDVVLPAIKAATTDAQLLLALRIFADWDVLTPLFLDTHAHVPGGRNAPSLVSRRQQWEQEFIIKIKQAITANNQLCASPGLTATRIAALDNTLFWHSVAALRGAATAQNGLDLPSFYSALCASVVSQNLTLADPLEELETHTLDVTFALTFSNGQSVPADFLVHATGSGASLTLPGATAQAPRGFYTGIVVPDPGAGVVVLDLHACYAYHGNQQGVFGGTKLCHTEHIVRNIDAGLAITTSALPAGTVGTSYSSTLQATGGVGNYQWSVSSGQLPPGLSLGAGGAITGTPTTAGTFGFTASVLSGVQHVQRALSITVGGSVLSIDTSVLPSGAIGTSYSQTLQASGGSGSYQWSVAGGQLPPGLSLSTGGTISGSPTTGGTFSFTLAVASGAQNAQRALSITIGSLGTIIGAYDGTETVTFTGGGQLFSGAGRWWLLQVGSLRVLVRGLIGSSAVPPLQTFVPPFVVPANGVFGASQNGVPTLSGTVGNGQLQFTWDALCNLMPPSFSTLGSCRLTFTGVLNPSP